MMTWLALACALTPTVAPPPEQSRFSHEVPREFALSKDGKRLAVGNWSVWDVPGGRLVHKGFIYGFSAMAFSPDNKYLALGGNFSHLNVYETETGRLYWQLNLYAHGDTIITHVEFTPDGRHLISASMNGVVRVWDFKEKKALSVFCFHSDYSLFESDLQIFLKEYPKVTAEHPETRAKLFVEMPKALRADIGRFALNPDSKTLAIPTNSPEVFFLDWKTGKVVKTLKTGLKHSAQVCYSADGSILAIAGSGEDFFSRGGVEWYDTSNGKCLHSRPGNMGFARAIAISSDKKTLATGGSEDGLMVWDVPSGRTLYRIRDGNPTKAVSCDALEFASDGSALLTLFGNVSKVFTAVDFREPRTGNIIPFKPKR